MKTLWNDGWVFLKTQPEENFTDVQQKAEEFQPVDVPHDWLIYDATKLYEDSRGWYRKQFYWDGDREKRVFLTFEGVYMDCCIYINQAPAFEWKYGYSGFTLNLVPFCKRGKMRSVSALPSEIQTAGGIPAQGSTGMYGLR